MDCTERSLLLERDDQPRLTAVEPLTNGALPEQSRTLTDEDEESMGDKSLGEEEESQILMRLAENKANGVIETNSSFMELAQR